MLKGLTVLHEMGCIADQMITCILYEENMATINLSFINGTLFIMFDPDQSPHIIYCTAYWEVNFNEDLSPHSPLDCSDRCLLLEVATEMFSCV